MIAVVGIVVSVVGTYFAADEGLIEPDVICFWITSFLFGVSSCE